MIEAIGSNLYEQKKSRENYYLLMLCISSSEVRTNWISPPNQKLQASLQEYVEVLPTDEKPWMYRWRNPDSKEYPTRRLLGTLGIRTKEDIGKDTKIFFQLMGTGILLYRHAKEEKLGVLATDFQLDEGVLESGLKFTITWILSSLAKICDPEKCYKLQHLEMRVYPLLETISLGSDLGKLADRKNIGQRTLRKLIASGIADLAEVKKLTSDELIQIGVTGKPQDAILSYARKSKR